jgi:hypothetical protein
MGRAAQTRPSVEEYAMPSAAQTYGTLATAFDEQRARMGQPAANERWSNAAQRFRDDPRREPHENLKTFASYLEPNDVLLDVGGGAGRYGLPLALHCKEVINIEPAAGMGQEFEASASEAGITNVRWLCADWLSAGNVTGDVSLVCHVTYFVRDIVPFLEKLHRATRRRVMIVVSSTPPPNQGSEVFHVIHGDQQALAPGHEDLLPVLWQMDILPDVHVLSSVGARATLLADNGTAIATRDAAIESLLSDPLLHPGHREDARARVDAQFDSLFQSTDGGFRRRLGAPPRLILITWESGRLGT